MPAIGFYIVAGVFLAGKSIVLTTDSIKRLGNR